MIPSLKMDQITDLDSMNISAVEGDSNVFLLWRLILKLISQVPPSTMFDITAWEKRNSTRKRELFPRAWSAWGGKVKQGGWGFHELWQKTTVLIPYYHPNLCHSIYFVKPRSTRVPWLKGADVCTPLLSHIIQRTNLFRSLTTLVLLIAQAPAIF